MVVKGKVECLAVLKLGGCYFSFHFSFVSLKDETSPL